MRGPRGGWEAVEALISVVTNQSLRKEKARQPCNSCSQISRARRRRPAACGGAAGGLVGARAACRGPGCCGWRRGWRRPRRGGWRPWPTPWTPPPRSPPPSSWCALRPRPARPPPAPRRSVGPPQESVSAATLEAAAPADRPGPPARRTRAIPLAPAAARVPRDASQPRGRGRRGPGGEDGAPAGEARQALH